MPIGGRSKTLPGCRVTPDGELLDPYLELVAVESSYITDDCALAADTLGHVALMFFTFESQGYMSNRARVAVFPRLTGGIEETMRGERRTIGSLPTVVHGLLFLPDGSGPGTGDRTALLDVSGRKMLDLHPGANDVRALATGVYFIREGQGIRGEGLGKMRKVVVAR